MEKKIIVSGNIISELSDKLPNNIIALNELIKNSYDAGATKVDIHLDTFEGKLVISDDGEGMDDSDINILLQISKSTKKYGSIHPKTGRYIQGSKGLGFLAVFKFGNVVKWTTIKNKKRRIFTIDYQKIIALNNISEYSLDVIEENIEASNGTTIEIILRSRSHALDLKNYFLDQMNREKILNSFLDNNFLISLKVDDQVFQTKKISLETYYPEYQLFHVTFTSETKEAIFTYKEHNKIGKTANPTRIEKYERNIDSRYKLVVNGHLKNSIFGHKKTSNFGHEKPAVIQNLSLAITVEELPRRQWSVAERLLGNSHSLSPVKLTCSYCYLSSWLY